MDAGINPTTGDLAGQRIDTLANAIYLRLVVPLGTYWADTTLGSRLGELRRQKDLARVAVLARQYAVAALQPLLDAGRASAIEVTVSRPVSGRLLLDIEATAAGGQQQTFQHWVSVI
jgi:phage gp46-like protein